MFKIFLFTLYISILSTVIAAFVGIAVAFFTANRRFALRRFILSLSAVPLCVPPLVVALGYVCFFGINGTANRFIVSLVMKISGGIKIESPLTFLYSTWGIIIAQGFYNFPFVTGIVNDAWCQLPQEQKNAARLLGAGEKRVFFTITLKQLSGPIAAACLPVFLFCFFSFMIVMLFSPMGRSTLEVEIYRAFRTTLNFGEGFALSVIETFSALFVVYVYSFVIRKTQIYSEGISFTKKIDKKIKGFELLPFLFLLLFIIIFFFCPFISIFFSARDSVIKVVASSAFKNAVINTFLVGISTGTLCTFCGFSYAVFVRLKKMQGNSLLQTIPLIPMAISSVVISTVAGVIFHKGAPVLLVFLETFLYWPIAYRQIQSGINKISSETDKACAMLSKNTFDSIIRVYIPSCGPALLSAFGYCFAVSAGDATMPLVLSIQKFNTLALYTYRLAGAYKFNQACVCGMLLFILCSMIFYLLNRFKNQDLKK